MKTCTLALALFLASSAKNQFGDAFTPTSLTTVRHLHPSASSAAAVVSLVSTTTTMTTTTTTTTTSTTQLNANSGFLGMDDEDTDVDSDDEDEDEDDEDDDDDDDMSLSRYSGAKSPFTGLKLDPWDPNPLIKPRPSRYFRAEDAKEAIIPDEQLVQTMSEQERKENLTVMRQIQKSDLPDLRRRKDHAGWVEANNDLKRRIAKDPWFHINERLRNAIQLGDKPETIAHLQQLAAQVGGPPPGIEIDPTRGYAVHTEIYDIPLSASRAAAVLERQIRMERAARGRAMMAERRKNLEAQQRQYEEDMRNPGVREDREAKARRERTMRRLMEEIEEDNKKKRERAKEILGKVPETPESRTKSMEKALKEAREEVKKLRRKQLGEAIPSGLGSSDVDIDDDDDDDDDDDRSGISGRSRPKSGADRAREAAAAEASGGRPRLPGDTDVTRGELGSLKIESSSSTVTGPLQVEVTSSYNKEQSDPSMRKHCFQYTIRITNNSPTDTIQLLGRRFEIQTVGSSMKDVVQGEGVTGRTPVLKPGEVFEYTSTAPLSVRPLGTTIIAARMRGEYRYVTLAPGQTTASEEQINTSDNHATAELGMFHFVFPEDQRVTPFRSDVTDDEEEEEDDDDDDNVVAESSARTAGSATAAAAAKTPSSATPATTPASTLPGDADMQSGNIAMALNDSSDAVTDSVRVHVSSSYRPERSDEAQNKHCFAYNVRITNESNKPIQLVSRRFEIQTIGSANKDVVQGPGVTGRQPILQPGESFEYTSTAPLSVKPMLDKTPVVARMQGEYNFVVLGEDGTTPLSSTPLQARLATFHFILPALT